MLLVLGFPSANFLNFFLFVVLPGLSWLYVRHKWRRAVAREQEVQRLLRLASQETALAELETSYSFYSSISSPLPSHRGYVDSYSEILPAPKVQPPVQKLTVPFHCALCYLPTKKLCARCKSVRYCSAKCQITHWREGHKDECHPCTTTNLITDEGNTSSWEAEKKGHGSYNYGSETEGTHDACAFSDMGPSSEVLSAEDDKSKEEYQGDLAPSLTSESSSTIFSKSSPSGSSGLSDEVSSNESIDASELGKKDDQNLDEISPNKPEASVKVEVVDQAKPLVSDANVSENVVNSFTSVGKLNENRPIFGAKAQQGSSSSSDLNIKGSGYTAVLKHRSTGNDFWNEALDYNWSTKGSTESNSREFMDGKLSDSHSSLKFSFKMTKISSEVTAHVPNGPQPGSSRISKSDREVIEEKDLGTTQKVAELTPLGSEESKVMKDEDGISSSDITGSKGGKSCTLNPVSVSCSSISSVKSSHVLSSSEINSNKSRSRENGSSSHSVVTHLSSHIGEQSAAKVKSAKVDSAHANDVIPSHTSGLPHNSNNGLKTSVWKVVDQLRAAKQLSKPCTLSAGSETSLRSNNQSLFPYELFVKLYMWNKVELQPCGLINCGNSCYANVVLQCLAFTPPLTAYFLQGLHRESCTMRDWCFTCEFESLILKAREGNSPVSPIGIISRLRSIGSHLSNGREEDAHEFLRCVVDTMQSECMKQSRSDLPTSLQEETSLVGLTLGGYLRSKIKCLKCEGKSERHERIMDLTVEIEGDIGTLDDALNRFTRTEILDGENKYECSRCKIYQKAKKKLTILEAPNVLTIALKRFQSGKFGKLNKSIEFPEILNLAKYMSSSSDKSPIYRLYGVVEHVDIMNSAFSGHYVCYVKNIQNKWFKIDDTVVKPVEIKKVKEKAAYMLFYARCSPRAPKSLRSKASRDPKLKIPASIPTAVSSNQDSHHTRHHVMQTIYETGSSSSESSIFSSCSDEGSWSSESSTRDSATSVDDLPDFRYGGAGSPWRNSSDSDSPCSSTSSSPVYSNQPGGDGWSKEGKGGTQVLHSDSAKLCRNSSSCCSETARLEVNGVKYNVLSSRTRSTREKSG